MAQEGWIHLSLCAGDLEEEYRLGTTGAGMTQPLPTRLRCHGRYAAETEREAAERRCKEREDAADEIERLGGELAELRKALVKRFEYSADGDYFCDACGAASPHPVTHGASCPIAMIDAALRTKP